MLKREAGGVVMILNNASNYQQPPQPHHLTTTPPPSHHHLVQELSVLEDCVEGAEEGEWGCGRVVKVGQWLP